MKIKTCFKCGVEKPLADFYKHPQMADGHVNKCKECNKKDVRDNREDKIDYYREYDVSRGSSRRTAEDTLKYRENNPEKYFAHTSVNNAVRDGRLLKSDVCEDCGYTGNIHGHHEDYSKPLEVDWLCPRCHSKRHKKY